MDILHGILGIGLAIFILFWVKARSSTLQITVQRELNEQIRMQLLRALSIGSRTIADRLLDMETADKERLPALYWELRGLTDQLETLIALTVTILRIDRMISDELARILEVLEKRFEDNSTLDSGIAQVRRAAKSGRRVASALYVCAQHHLGNFHPDQQTEELLTSLVMHLDGFEHLAETPDRLRGFSTEEQKALSDLANKVRAHANSPAG